MSYYTAINIHSTATKTLMHSNNCRRKTLKPACQQIVHCADSTFLRVRPLEISLTKSIHLGESVPLYTPLSNPPATSSRPGLLALYSNFFPQVQGHSPPLPRSWKEAITFLPGQLSYKSRIKKCMIAWHLWLVPSSFTRLTPTCCFLSCVSFIHI